MDYRNLQMAINDINKALIKLHAAGVPLEKENGDEIKSIMEGLAQSRRDLRALMVDLNNIINS